MSGRLAGRVAVVTGAGDGIGRGIARRFAAEGAKVLVAELDPETGGKVADEVGGLFVRTDVTDKAQVHAMGAAFRRMAAAHPEIEAAADRANPMGRLGDPEADIAPVAVFLASEDARYLTGNTLFADGGSHINGVAWTPDLDGEG